MKKTAALAIFLAVLTLARSPQSYGQTGVFTDLNPSDQEFRERSLCSDYLRMLPPFISRKLSIADDVASELRSIGQRRFEKQNGRISEIQSSGVAIEDGRDGLIRFDNELAKRQFDELHDLLPQNELDSLMREYFRTYSFEKLLDPLAAQWSSITTEELAAITELHEQYQAAIAIMNEQYLPADLESRAGNQSRVTKIPFGGNISPEIEAKQRELAQLEARRWSAISQRKLERCFEKIGLISRGETLADYLIRNREKSEIYIEELPAFAIARLRACLGSAASRISCCLN